MTLSAISNTTVARNQGPQQKAGTAAEPSEEKRPNLSSHGSSSGKKIDDTVTLSQADKAAGPSRTLDAKAVEQVLPRTKAAILQDSRVALASQANISSRTAQEFLSDN